MVVLLILIPLIFGAIELSRAVTVKAALDSGVATAARLLALDPDDWGRAANVVSTTVAHNVFGEAGLGTVNFGAVDSAGIPLTQSEFSALTYGDLFCVRGWVDYNAWVPLIPLGTITIRVEHCGVVEEVD
ncbi:MAG: hypothetical protein JW929_14180 [Anaerolineales bacterium]|nr:hypothetical protein [Anaerolineales bacterium]